jgi:hypothetical protein
MRNQVSDERLHSRLNHQNHLPMSMMKEFKEFAIKGNLIDIAVVS